MSSNKYHVKVTVPFEMLEPRFNSISIDLYKNIFRLVFTLFNKILFHYTLLRFRWNVFYFMNFNTDFVLLFDF